MNFIEKLFGLYYWNCEEIMILNDEGIPIDSYDTKEKYGKLSGFRYE